MRIIYVYLLLRSHAHIAKAIFETSLNEGQEAVLMVINAEDIDEIGLFCIAPCCIELP